MSLQISLVGEYGSQQRRLLTIGGSVFVFAALLLTLGVFVLGGLQGTASKSGAGYARADLRGFLSTADLSGDAGDAQHPNLAGEWNLVAVEGDPDHVMYNAGVGWFQRTAAAAMGFGVGHVHVHLEQNGNAFVIESSTPLGSSTVKFTVGGGKQRETASDGGSFEIEPVWSKNEVKSTLWRNGVVTKQRRYKRGKQMCIESVVDGYYPKAMSREVYDPSA